MEGGGLRVSLNNDHLEETIPTLLTILRLKEQKR